MTSDESILGEIPVATRLALGSERLSIFVTDSRFIVAHLGKRGTGAMVSSSVLGKLGSALEDLFKTGKESVGKRGLRNLEVHEILAADNENFFVRFDEIVTVTVTQGARLTGLTILTIRDKLEFTTQLGFNSVVELLKPHLPSKLTLNRNG